MAWPKATDYGEALQNPRLALGDEELRAGEVAYTPLGLPMLWSGNFADVYKIHNRATGNTWALKCFTRKVRGLQERYRSIAAHLEQARLPFTVDFRYLEQGVRVGGEWFPALKMRWVEGLTLNQFVEEHLERPHNLKMLLDLWVKLAGRLRAAGVAHADLQHGNVLLVPANGGALALRLIDYDGMYVPSLAGVRSGELGHPAYQHPQRLREGTYHAEIDRFSHLVIYTAVRCLMLGRGDLWRQFNNGDNLLFRESDFCRPGGSELFHALWELPDEEIRSLVARLIVACQRPLEESPLLDEIVADGKVRPLVRAEEEAAAAAAGPANAVTRGTVSAAAAADQDDLGWPQPEEPAEAEAAGGTQPATAAGTVPGPATAEKIAARLATLAQFDWKAAAGRVARAPAQAAWRGVHAVDRGLKRVAGEENAILHGFLRVTAACVVVSVLGLGLVGLGSLRGRTAPEAPAGSFDGPSDQANVAATAAGPARPAPEDTALDSDPATVQPTPTPPAKLAEEFHLNPVAPRAITAGDELTFRVTAQDAKQGERKLRFGLGPHAPPGARIEPETGMFIWTPTERQAPGQYGISVVAEGPGGQTDQTAFTVNVMQAAPAVEQVARDVGRGGSQTPRLKPIAAQTIEAGQPLAVAVAVEDPQRWQGKLRFSVSGPAGACVDQQSGAFTWTPSEYQDPGRYDVAISVEGPNGQKDQMPFTVTVTDRVRPMNTEITIELGGGVSLQLVLLPAGSFMMGDANSKDPKGRSHNVTIGRPFFLGKYEVTQEQWQAVMGRNPSRFKGPRHPVEQVSWSDCQKFVGKLNSILGLGAGGFRLPTEAEWEYACRAGSTGRWCFGDDEARLRDYAWYHANSGTTTHPVGQKRPNAWGLHDMHGNVQEWCGEQRNVPTRADQVFRGGSWFHASDYTYSARRDRGVPGYHDSDTGLRVAKTQ